MNTNKAKEILKENQSIKYGSFDLVTETFPSLAIFNDFLKQGKDHCDQDELMSTWKAFTLNQNEFNEVINWWKKQYPKTKVDSLGQTNWTDWFVEHNEKEENR